jgi:hypothetical protein
MNPRSLLTTILALTAAGCATAGQDDTAIEPDSSDDGSSVNDATAALADSSDAGSDGAADSAQSIFEAGILCGAKLGTPPTNGSLCQTGEIYVCGGDTYRIECACPAAQCTCTKNSVQVGSTGFAGCPGCASPSFPPIAAACGIPY